MKKRHYLFRICGVVAVLASIIISANASAVRPFAISRSYSGQILGGYVDVAGPGGSGKVYLGSTFSDSSADGNLVVFTSTNAASEFVPGVTDLGLNLANNVFARDLRTNTTTCLSCRTFMDVYTSWGGFTPRITPDGRYVVFAGSPPTLFPPAIAQIYRYDLQTGTEDMVSIGMGNTEGDFVSLAPVVSDDGRYVAFISQATNLVAGFQGSGTQLFVRDMQAGQTFLASHAAGSSTQAGNAAVEVTQPLSISANGRFTVWTSSASNYSAFIADTNGVRDVFYFDVISSANNIGVASLESIGISTANGPSTGGIISPGSGSFPPQIVFASNATNIDAADTSPNMDIYRFSGNARLMSVARDGAGSNGVASPRTAVSRNGRFVAFSSTASNLVPGFDEPNNMTPDVFVRDLQTNETSCVSLSNAGSASTTTTGAVFPASNPFAGDGANLFLNRSISDDGRYIAFVTNERLSGRDNAGTLDVYVRDRISGISILASLANNLNAGQSGSKVNTGDIALAASGHKVSFTTLASNLSPDDATTAQNTKAYQANISLLAERSKSDRDGDQKNDFSVFRPSEGAWYSLLDRDTSRYEAVLFGEGGNQIVPGDYDGDGRVDYAMFAPAAGRWDILRSSDNELVTRFFGTAADILTPGDFDGDGRTDLAYFRPANGSWYILQSNSDSLRSVHFGQNGDMPVVGDYDGDNRADVAVFRPSSGDWFVRRSSDNTYFGIHWGMNGDTPVAGDFDGDGKTDLTVFRGGIWYIRNSRDETIRAENWGLASDRLVVSDYDGDGRSDLAVYRPSSGMWYVLQSSTNSYIAVNWGMGTDIPLPDTHVP